MENSTVNTPCGMLKGIREDGIRKFLGIRFASCRRWERAKEITSWEGVYDATEFGPGPMQERSFMGNAASEEASFYYNEFYKGRPLAYDEDCLYLNVYAPEHAENCPVLFFIYGGAFASGQSNELEFDGTEYAKRGIVFVSANYRVNMMGMFCHPMIQDKYGASGNDFLYDQRVGIDWVIHNIHALGGNHRQITLMGQSAGAACVEMQMRAPVNKGLFHGGIMLSAPGLASNAYRPCPKEKAYTVWDELYRASGCTSIEELQEMPVRDLYDLWYSLKHSNRWHFTTFVIDHNMIPDNFQTPLDGPMIGGSTTEDGMPYLMHKMVRGFAEKQQRANKPDAYVYLFGRHLPGDDFGAWHASDLWYVFGTLDRSWRPFTEADRALSRQMIDYFSNFVKTANPNGEQLPSWLPAQKGRKEIMFFGDNGCAMKKPESLRMLKATIYYNGPKG